MKQFGVWCFLLLAPFAAAQSPDPEAATKSTAKQAVTAKQWMAVAANPHASRAAASMLEAGGSAVDAAIAAQLVLNLVEPQSSGLGGGAFVLTWSKKTGELRSYDGREVAPAASTPQDFLGPDGKPLGFFTAIENGRAVAVPGLPRLLETLHRAHGKLPWATLFEPAIKLAETGFAVSPRLATLLAQGQRYFDNTPDMHAVYYHGDGTPLSVGETFKNPALAKTLRDIAKNGADAFYKGELARQLLAKLQQAAATASTPVTVRMQASDLVAYRTKLREPICEPYRAYRVCSAGMPSSGGATTLEALGMLANFDLPSMKPDDPRAWHLLAEAERRAYADRERYMADSDFVQVPVQGLLDRAYLAGRAATIDPTRVTVQRAPAGEPAGAPPSRAPDRSLERPGTSHLTVVDKDGLVVSMTTSIETAFGSRLIVGGFILNNHMTDFSLAPTGPDGAPVANRIEPNKRPRSSMMPTIVFDANKLPVLTIGSPGGSAIPGYVMKSLVARLDWKMDLQAALDLPHVFNRNGTTELETSTFKAALEAMGHQVRVSPQSSGLHAIAFENGLLIGAADPRREGLAIGK
ncbi:gamma-glutamyltransferase [Roseiterribacter gracilis]|uniref:Glutathione hydrolase proenzyme n=1 Tax=Roseiterribacter gracilis TaxID=2812848 RepID=A0A8S8XEK8_9PROT|nr:gamma-glutamyltranspeptidase [Rhodospirillales bacterium TMPK1]